MLRGTALLVGDRVPLVNQPLGVDPAQGVLSNVELPGSHGSGFAGPSAGSLTTSKRPPKTAALARAA